MLKRLTIPSLLIMLSTGAQALTLGQIHVHSFISEPLKATIDLQGVKADELTALKIKLASLSDFKNAGVEWSKQLKGLSFSIIQSDKGPAIRVTSSKAVVEPFLSFVIDARWANGEMIKDYTLLLDPPLYSGKMAAPVDVAGVASMSDKPQVQSDDSRPQQQAIAQRPATEASGGEREADSTMQTMTGTTLWQVASKSRPADASMHQAMVAIHEENPESFIRGNMNLLKKGQLLRIPSAEVTQGISRSAARERVAQHESAFRARKPITSSTRLSPEIIAQVVTEPAEPPVQQEAAAVTPPPPSTESEGRLRLDSAADDVNEGAMSGDPASSESDLSTETAAGEENKVLRSRVKLLEEQLKVAHKLIHMKGELAQLQQLYSQIDAQKGADADQTKLTDEQLLLLVDSDSDAAEKRVAEESDQEPLGADDAYMKDEALAGNSEQQQSAATADKSEEVESSRDNAEQLSMAAAGEEDPVAGDETPAKVVDSSLATAEEESTSPPTENQRKKTAVAWRDSLIEGIDNNLLFGAAGVAILVLLLILLRGRRSRKESTEPDSAHTDEHLVDESLTEKGLAGDGAVQESEGESVRESSDADETLDQQPKLESTTLFEPPETLSIVEPQALDPLELATVLISNGENRQAQDVLMQAVEMDPARMDLQMQLMELLYSEKNRHAFEAVMSQLDSSALNIDPGDWKRIEHMHAELLPAGIESLGVVDPKHSDAEIINLDFGAAEISSDEEMAESNNQPDYDLEEALRAFEVELEDKKSGELLSEVGMALDETAEILDNPAISAMPGIETVEDLELDEELVADESAETDQGFEVISLDDSFGIDSHINDDFEDVFSRSADQGSEQSDTLSLDEEDTLPIAESEEPSITSLETASSTLKQVEAEAKIDLAAAFADMGDMDGARDILEEVMSDGTRQQQQAAQEMLKKLL